MVGQDSVVQPIIRTMQDIQDTSKTVIKMADT